MWRIVLLLGCLLIFATSSCDSTAEGPPPLDGEYSGTLDNGSKISITFEYVSSDSLDYRGDVRISGPTGDILHEAFYNYPEISLVFFPCDQGCSPVPGEYNATVSESGERISGEFNVPAIGIEESVTLHRD